MAEASASSAASATSGIRTSLRPQLKARISFSGMDRQPQVGQRVQEQSDDYAVTMKVKVILFAVFREIVGNKEEEVEVDPGTTVQKLLDSYISRFPQMARFREHIILSVNKEYGPPGKVLREGDEVSFLPPVSGG